MTGLKRIDIYIYKKPTMKNEMKLASMDMMKKYSNLVWYARSDKNTSNIEIQKQHKEYEELYPIEIAQLNGNESDFYHGFNSGMLAAMRFALSKNLENALEDFPNLDS